MSNSMKMTNKMKKSVEKKKRSEILITYMMISIVAVFLIVQLLYNINTILLVVKVLKPKYDGYVPVLRLTNVIFATISASINTLIYCIFNEKFRDVFFQWILPNCLRKKFQNQCQLVDPSGIEPSGTTGVNV